MKNDVKKVNEITTEMRINDLIYKIIDDELEDMIYDCDELDKEFEKLYFAKRVLSVFQNNDMPIRAAVGLLDNVDIIEALYTDIISVNFAFILMRRKVPLLSRFLMIT